MPSQNTSKQALNLTLEQKLTRLQEIQKLLESGAVNLTESISLFEEASILKIKIEEELKTIKLKITQIEATQQDENMTDI